jgi:hypothetical protein
MSVYQGSGGPPPQKARKEGGGGGGGPRPGQKPFGFGLYEALPSGKNAKIWNYRVKVGEKNVPTLILDAASPENEHHPSVRIHDGFKFNGTFGNSLICVSHRPEGCLGDIALQKIHEHAPWCKTEGPDACTRLGEIDTIRGSWRWVATAIKLQPWTFQKGPLEGKTIPYQRTMLLVPESQYEDFMEKRETYKDKGGLRGMIFNVSREDKQRSSKIGTSWNWTGERLTDEEMMERFADAAAMYGLPVEEYCKPYDYEKVLREFTPDEMKSACAWIAAERGINLDSPTEPVASTADAATTSSEGEGSDNDIPF